MLARVCFGLLLLACTPAWCQLDTGSSDADNASTDNSQLRVPPPVSGQAYPTTFAGETESNYLSGGFTLTSAYSSDVTGGTNPIGDMSYSFWPTIAVDKVTPRLQLVLGYSPGFTIYQRSSGYNSGNQNINANFQYRISPNMTISLQEGFHKTSNIFDQPNPLSATPVSGSVPVPGVAVIAPIADQLNNTTGAQLTYQVGESSTLGAGATFNTIYYPNPEQVSDLYNSRSAGGSVFYSRRLREKYYLGVTYRYQYILSYQASSPGSQTDTQTVFMFFSVYLKPTLTVSISGGPQHYTATQPPFPASSAWSPLLTVSVGWQGQRTTLAASYSRIVSGGGGLNGAFHSNSAGASANWKMSRDWNAGVAANYTDNQTLTPLFLSSSGGRTLLGTVSAQRSLGEHASLQFGYSWTSQNYEQIMPIASAPNVNRVFVSLSYQFTRPLHR
jgi:hypothetical protein